MNILRCYLRIPPVIGGMENHIIELSKTQRSLNHKVDIAFNIGQITSKYDIQLLNKFNLYAIFSTPICFFIFYGALIFKLILKRPQYDIVHIHGDWSSYIFAPILKKLTRAQRIYFSFHGSINNESFSHKHILPFTLRACDKIFVTGYESYLFIKKISNAILQPSGVNNTYFRTNLENNKTCNFLICTVTVLRPNKNVKTVLDIAQKLPFYKFQIIGDGVELSNLKQIALDRHLTNVTFLGFQGRANVQNYLSQADLFLFTSLEEGTPTAVMEAMACGLPIVCSNAGGSESIIHDNENGFVVRHDYNDVDAYIDNINKILLNTKLWSTIRNNNLKKSKNFNWEIVAANITNEMIKVK